MATTRDFNSLGIWADDAETVIPMAPAEPVEGVDYRNDTLTPSENEAGEGFDTKPDSADFNQKMFIITSFIDEMDKHGIVGWSDQVNYVVPVITWGSDGIFYTALQDSGPAGVGFKDPISEPTYWEQIFGSSSFELDLTSQVEGDEGAKLVGTTYQPDPSLPVVGQTVQDSLEIVDRQAFILHDLSLGLSGRFDDTGALISNGFNILNNIAEKITSQGLNFYRITPADGSSPFLYNTYVSAERPIDGANPTNLLTANIFVVLGNWQSGQIIIDNTPTIKIVFTDPYDINTTFFPPFSMTSLFRNPP